MALSRDVIDGATPGPAIFGLVPSDNVLFRVLVRDEPAAAAAAKTLGVVADCDVCISRASGATASGAARLAPARSRLRRYRRLSQTPRIEKKVMPRTRKTRKTIHSQLLETLEIYRLVRSNDDAYT